MKKYRRARGMTLTELMAGMAVLAVLSASAFQIARMQSAALASVKNGNIALFALEGLRNRILTEMMKDFSFNSERARPFLKDMHLPWPIKIEDAFDAETSSSGHTMRLTMEIPAGNGRPSRAYVREIHLP